MLCFNVLLRLFQAFAVSASKYDFAAVFLDTVLDHHPIIWMADLGSVLFYPESLHVGSPLAPGARSICARRTAGCPCFRSRHDPHIRLVIEAERPTHATTS